MKNFYVLTDALKYIEDNICEEIDSQDVADSCCVSLSSLQKLFRLALHRSVKDYIIKRKICLAARDILESDMKIIDIAYKYQFGSPEHFVRTFKKVWNETPTEYKKHWKFSGIYPKLDYKFEEGADQEMARKKVDISEMYEEIVKVKDTYVLCVDIIGLVPINDIAFEAGDLAILEAAKRIDNVSTESMMQLRIGGDEFALITGSSDLTYVESLVNNIVSHNEECIEYNGQKIPLSLRVGIIRTSAEDVKYDKLFSDMHKAIQDTRIKENI